MRASIPTLAVLAGLVTGTGIAPTAAFAQESRAPSEILHDIAKARLENPRWTPAQVEAALEPLLARAQRADLSPAEEVALGLSYFLTFDGPSARPIFEKHMDRADDLGRVSWQSLQQMSFFGAKDYALVEQRLKEFRQKYSPRADEPEYTYNMVNNLARHFASNGDHARAVRLILEDVQHLPLHVAMRSFELLNVHMASFEATGQKAAALDWMKRHHDALRAATPAGSDSSRPAAGRIAPQSLQIAHRPGVIHLFPFAELLYPDLPAWTPNRAIGMRHAAAIGKFSGWIAEAERTQ